MILGRPQLVEQGQDVRIQTLVEFEGRKKHLWYSVESRYGDCLTTDNLDPFVVGMLVPAMLAREDIHVEGPLSERLHWNLKHYYMRILSSVNPAFHPVRILADELSAARSGPRPAGVATGFSGGIDSFCVLADHFFDAVPPARKITHLIFNNVGSHGKGGQELFIDRYERLLPCAHDMGLPFIRIDSNLDTFYRIGFEQTHTPRNVSAALSLQKVLGTYLYASGLKCEDCFIGPAPDSAYSDPFAVHWLSTETIDCISTGWQYSRVTKTVKVAQLEPSHRYLNVCISRHGKGNCALCEKCARTLVTLELLGKISLYEEAFPLEMYRSSRRRCLAKVLSKRSPLTREILLLAKEKGYRFPWETRVLALVRRASAHLRNLLRR